MTTPRRRRTRVLGAILLVALAAALSLAAASSLPLRAAPDTGARIFFTLRHNPHFQFGRDEFAWWLDRAEDWKFDGIAFEIAWNAVERKNGEFDFRVYDKKIQEMVDRGFALQVKLNLRYFPSDLGAGEQMLSADGTPLLVRLHLGETGTPTLAEPAVVERMADFARAVARHFKERGFPVESYCPHVDWGLETGYDGRVWTDWSPSAVEDFRVHLRKKYDTVEALSGVWGTSFSAWEEVGIVFDGKPVAPGAPDMRPGYLDFMSYREATLKRFVERIGKGLREGDPEARLAVQVARLYHGEAPMRGGVGIFSWAAAADEIIVDPAPVDDAIAAVDGIRAAGILPGAEVTGPAEYSLYRVDFEKGFRSQLRAVVQAGAKRVYVANFTKADIEGFPFARQEVLKAKGTPAILPLQQVAIYHSKWDLYAYHGHGYPELAFRPQDALLRPIDVITDDMFLGNPAMLARYKIIYVPRGDFVSDEALEKLRASGARLVSPRGEFARHDEFGVRRAESEDGRGKR